MKRVLLLGAALSVLGGVALAAPTPPAPAVDSPSTSKATEQLPTDQLARADFGDWHRGGGHWRDRSEGDDGDNGPPMRGPWHGHGHPFAMAFKGPHVILEHGRDRLVVKCGENDSTRDCVDAVKDLLTEIGKTFGHGPDSDDGPDGPETPAP